VSLNVSATETNMHYALKTSQYGYGLESRYAKPSEKKHPCWLCS